jgi:hypothetical protein
MVVVDELMPPRAQTIDAGGTSPGVFVCHCSGEKTVGEEQV